MTRPTRQKQSVLRRVVRWTARGLMALIILILLLGIGGYIWLRTGLPQQEGEQKIAGLLEPVTIDRDNNSIVTIRAATEHDAYMALGYVHAQDRLFQMDLTRRVGAGRLSEILGESTLAYDKLMRTLGLYRIAEANYAELHPATQAALDTYAAGVNAYLDGHEGAWSPEFYLLNYRPERWKAADSLVWGRIMAWQLSGNAYEEAANARKSAGVQGQVSDPVLKLLDPRFASVLPDIWPGGQRNIASNNWVVSGSRTASGKPLLANDPHLTLNRPSVWYLVRMEITEPALTLEGVTAPGVPFIVIGHNQHVAWGFTTTHSDTQDLFIEQLSPDGQKYASNAAADLWHNFLTREEVISIKDKEPIKFMTRQSYHGPIVSDLDSFRGVESDKAYALAWPGFDADDLTAQALYRLNHATKNVEVIGALHDFDSPQQNAVFATVDGHIGFVAAGKVPIRRNQIAAGADGVQASGIWRAAGTLNDSTRPVPGTGTYDWYGNIPFDLLPQEYDPPRGWIATANNKITDEFYPFFLGASFEAPYRIDRITMLLGKLPTATSSDMAAMQMDDLSLAAQETLPKLLEILDQQALASREISAADLLRQWDFHIHRDQTAPLIFNNWLRHIDQRRFPQPNGDRFFQSTDMHMEDLSVALDSGTVAASIATEAFSASLQELTSFYGEDMHTWRWGEAHRAALKDNFWSRVPVVGTWFDADLETDGDNFTLNRGTAGSPRDAILFPHLHGASLRMIVDLAQPNAGQFIIAGGQSGHILSPHYDDLASLWQNGEFLTMVRPAQHQLRLVP